MTRISGGCRCGQVRYDLDPDGAIADFCHCSDCRRATGGVTVAWVQVTPDRFRIGAGTPTGHSVTAGLTRWFCATCGTHTHMTDAAGRSVGVTLGSLDDCEAVRPAAHGFWSARPSWLVLGDDLPRHDAAPPYDEDG